MSQCSETKNQHEVVVPRTDFFRSEGAYAMHIEVPGVSAEEISLDTTERTLSLTASAAVLERRFQRTYRIP
ncbi:MAG: Hsp20/alpha crystallin family protein, partial [Nannocystaceae bacterium]